MTREELHKFEEAVLTPLELSIVDVRTLLNKMERRHRELMRLFVKAEGKITQETRGVLKCPIKKK